MHLTHIKGTEKHSCIFPFFALPCHGGKVRFCIHVEFSVEENNASLVQQCAKHSACRKERERYMISQNFLDSQCDMISQNFLIHNVTLAFRFVPSPFLLSPSLSLACNSPSICELCPQVNHTQ